MGGYSRKGLASPVTCRSCHFESKARRTLHGQSTQMATISQPNFWSAQRQRYTKRVGEANTMECRERKGGGMAAGYPQAYWCIESRSKFLEVF